MKQIALPEMMAMCADLQPLFAKHCPTLPTVKLRQMKTQWGNCRKHTNTLTFSYNLAFAPMAAIEYVVVHELTHLRVANHGPDFQRLMDARLPGWRMLRRRLNRGQ